MLEGKINLDGVLCIKRAGAFKNQVCPFTAALNCGDMCPLFHEPRWVSESVCCLDICKTTFHFDVFHDQRHITN